MYEFVDVTRTLAAFFLFSFSFLSGLSYLDFIQGWLQVQATVSKSKCKNLDIFQVQIQVQVQSLCYVLKSKSKYMYLDPILTLYTRNVAVISSDHVVILDNFQ